MSKRVTSAMGVCGVVCGVAGVGTEALPLIGWDDDARAAAFRVLFGLAVITLLSAILLTATGLARTLEKQRTLVQPIVDAFLIGRGISDGGHMMASAGGHVEGNSGPPEEGI